MREAAGGDPAHYLALVPDRLVAQHVGIDRLDDHGDAAERAARRLLLHRLVAADEVVLGEVDETVHAGFEAAVDGAQLAVPGGEVLLEAHGEKGTHAEVHDAMLCTRLHDLLIEPALILRRHPDFVAEVTV